MPIKRCALVSIAVLWVAGLGSPASIAADNPMLSARAAEDPALDPNPSSPFWSAAHPVTIDLGNDGKKLPSYATEVRSRWTSGNLYFLFRCPYEELYLKPNPDMVHETNELWNWDVAEVFIGSDFSNIRRYKEFEVSPRGEWVDLDIDLSKTHPEEGWLWNSGLKVAVRVDEAAKVWYAALRIPFNAISPRPAAENLEFRINLYLSEGPPSNHKSLAWHPTLVKNFHIPERFGTLKLVGR